MKTRKFVATGGAHGIPLTVLPCECACHHVPGFRCGGACCKHDTAKAAVLERHHRIKAEHDKAEAAARVAYAGKDVTIRAADGIVYIESNTREFYQAAPVTFPEEDPTAMDRLLVKFGERHDSFPLRDASVAPKAP